MNSSAVNRTFNGSVKNNKIPNKKQGSSNAAKNSQVVNSSKYQNQYAMYMSNAANPGSVNNKSMINPINVMDISNHLMIDLNNFHTANNSANNNN